MGAHLERFGIGLDRSQRRFQLVRNVGDKLPPQILQPPQLRNVVQHEHDARARLAGQSRGSQRENATRRTGSFELLLHRQRRSQRLHKRRMNREAAGDFQERTVQRIGHGHIEQFAARFVG